jgi:hypothetical protein
MKSFPRECEDKDMAAMLDDIIKEAIANKKSFDNDLQHGGYDITCNRRMIVRADFCYSQILPTL